MRHLLLGILLAQPVWAQTQPASGSLMLEAGLSGGKSPACPGQYAGIQRGVTGPVSLYYMLENYRCVDLAGTAHRIGVSVRVGRLDWPVHPAIRAAVEYDGGERSRTFGASLTAGRRYGARFFVDRGVVSGGEDIVVLHLGGFYSF